MNQRLLNRSIFLIFLIFLIVLIYFLVFYENCEANAQYPIIGIEPNEDNLKLTEPLPLQFEKKQPTDIASPKDKVTESINVPC